MNPRSANPLVVSAAPGGPALSRRHLLGGVVAGGLVVAGAGTLAGPGTAHAAGPAAVAAPTVHTREEWAARPPTIDIEVLDHGPDHIVVHHTATDNATDYSKAHAFQLSRDIQDLHMDTNGWGDIGEQLTISRGGYVMEGRDQSLEAIRAGHHVVGAQCANQNSHTIGIENEGLYTDLTPPTALLNSLVATMAWLCDVYGLDPQEGIVGHRDYVTTTVCPGDTFYAMLPDLRNRVEAAMGERSSARQRARATARRPHAAPAAHRAAPVAGDGYGALGRGEKG